jgi:hypothetical protein
LLAASASDFPSLFRFFPESLSFFSFYSLGIQLSDTLTSEQEKTIRKALKVREDQLKQKAETQDSAKPGKRAANARKAKLHTKEKGDASGEEEDEKEDKG